MKVYLKESNTIYIGYMENYDIEMGSENFIILTSYIKAKEKKDGNLKYIIKNKQNDANDKIYISYNEIKCIEKISQCKIDKYYEWF